MNPKSYGVGVPTDSTESVDRGDYRDGNRVGDRGRVSESHGRTDGLTKNNSPESLVSPNASPAGGQNESPSAVDFLAQRYLAAVSKLAAVERLLAEWDDEISTDHGSRRDGLRKARADLSTALIVAGVSRVTPQDQKEATK